MNIFKIKHTIGGCIGDPVNRYCLHSKDKMLGCIETLVSDPSRICFFRIEEKYRRQGHGRKLIEHIFKKSDYLQVTSCGDAMQFYEKVGFKKVNGYNDRILNNIDIGVTHYRKNKNMSQLQEIPNDIGWTHIISKCKKFLGYM